MLFLDPITACPSPLNSKSYINLITLSGLSILSSAALNHSTFSGFIGLSLGLLINSNAKVFNVGKSLILSSFLRSSTSKLTSGLRASLT